MNTRHVWRPSKSVGFLGLSDMGAYAALSCLLPPWRREGTRHDRPELAKAIAALGPGDTLACYTLNRIDRSLAHLSSLLDDLNARGIKFKTVSDGLDTSGSTGRLVLHMLAEVAQFERDLIVERTRAGLAAAKKSGRKFGAPVKWTPDMAAKVKGYFKKGLNGDEVARQLKVSRRTLFRGLRATRDHDQVLGA